MPKHEHDANCEHGKDKMNDKPVSEPEIKDAIKDQTEEDERDIVDLDGEPFEVIYGIEYDGATYVALTPYVEDLDDETGETEFVILKEVEENGEYTLETVDDEELYEKLGEIFLERFDELFEDDDE
jgi:hypothetical protein